MTKIISAALPYQKQRRQVPSSEMTYVKVGQGDPIVLLHGNPTSSYLWRNVLPHPQMLGHCIAPNLIGMGIPTSCRTAASARIALSSTAATSTRCLRHSTCEAGHLRDP